MPTIQQLKKKIDSINELQSVVRTMKSLAAVNIRQYEKAADSLEKYYNTVEMGLQVVLRNRTGVVLMTKPAAKRKTAGVLIFGSDQGMCGSLNEKVVRHAVDRLKKEKNDSGDPVVLTVGERLNGLVEDEGLRVSEVMHVPGSVSGATSHVQQLLMTIEAWNEKKNIDRIFLFYNEHQSQTVYQPRTIPLLPIDENWLMRIQNKKWDTKMIPQFRQDADHLFSDLIREYLFVSIYRAFMQSLASENASRLAAMENAEKNIKEMLSDLNTQYHKQRQMEITEELLDIVSGFEALNQ